MEVRELGHLVLYVRNLERSAAFYRDVLGWRQVLPGEGEGGTGVPGRRVLARAAPTTSCCSSRSAKTRRRSPPGRRVGLYHFGLKVGDTDDELRDALARLQEAGVTVVGASDHTVTHSLYILDPDGNEIELYIDVPGVDWVADPALIAAPVARLRL